MKNNYPKRKDAILFLLLTPLLAIYWIGTLIALITALCNDFWDLVKERNHE